LIRHPIDLGFMPERIGRPACGILLGLFLSGGLFIALAMAPLPNKYPYQRFDAAKPNPESASGVLFNVDDFVTGWFNRLSGGSFSGDTSFAAVHPSFISQLYLARHSEDENVDVITTAQAIEVPPKKAVWPAPDVLKDADSPDTTISAQSDNILMIVHIGLKKDIKESVSFTLSQVRIICKPKEDAKDALKGKGKNIYPLGYLTAADQMKKKGLKDTITFKRDGTGEKSKSKLVDFVFEVPNDYVPVLIEYKQNNIASLPSPISAEQAMSEETAAMPPKETTEDSEKEEKSAEESNP
jgi:hypothetical protein